MVKASTHHMLDKLFKQNKPTLATWWHTAVATCGGAGLLPFTPGTWGSLAALGAAWGILHTVQSAAILTLIFVVTYLLGYFAIRFLEEKTHAHDAGMFVIDEVVGIWLPLFIIGLPQPSENVNGPWWQWWAITFILFRIFDMAKFDPITKYFDQKDPSPHGVMMDDIVAGAYTLICVLLLKQAGFSLPIF